jgi:uncharacterized protein
MPTTPTYPGVYIEEVPSGVRTITGVSTSDTAFVDFFAKGPVDKAVRVTSYGDFERSFGGLDSRSEASYAIQQYFLNGGSVAWVVRVLVGKYRKAKVTLTESGKASLTFAAASPGRWGNNLVVATDTQTADRTKLFNLVVREVKTVNGREQILASETYRNLSLSATHPRYAVTVLEAESALVSLETLTDTTNPPVTGSDVIGNPQGTNFKALGTTALTDPNTGSDGDEPGTTEWNTSGRTALLGDQSSKTGIYALERIAPFIFNLLCIPAAAKLSAPSAGSKDTLLEGAIQFCQRQRAFFLVDIPEEQTLEAVKTWIDTNITRNSHAAVYFPRLQIADPLNENRTRNVGASGTMAGIYGRTDSTRGVWKAPAGIDAALRGATVAVQLTDQENGQLNPLGINVLRSFPIYGNVAWGARTLEGADKQASEWKYIPVRRLALYLEESLYQGLKWVVFEPNDEPLWAQIRLNVGAFMNNLFRQGAFQGKTPREAYLVKCDRETTTQNDINLGIVNIVVGFAPLKPAEFVIIKIQQMAGQIST